MSKDLGYLGNPNLKKAGVQHLFTQEQLEEISKCSNDPIYFAKHYIKIVSLDEGLISFELWPFQEELITLFSNNRFVICKCPRQVGKSSTTIAYLLHQILFREFTNVAILANKGSTARKLLGRLQLAYEKLPLWLQQGIIIWNRGDIELENGSKILAESTSASTVRGDTFNIIFLDEFAHIQKNQADEFFNSVYPTISSGKTSQVIIVSTPKGLNSFYSLWIDAVEKRSEYIPFEVHWSVVPGRNEAWKEQTIKNTSKEQFQQEFCCDFLGSSSTLISGSKLKTLKWKKPIISEEGLDIHVDTEAGHTYVITVDPSRGQGMDYQAFSVIDVTQIPYRQVAKYRNNNISSLLFPTVIATAGRKYNDAYVLVETSDNGQQCSDILHYELEYENIVKVMMKGRRGQEVTPGFKKQVSFGVKTSTAVKRIGCSNLKALIEGDKLLIQDFDTIHELSVFTSQKESYRAEEGENDDIAMSLVLFGWLANQKYFKDSLSNDIRKALQSEKMNINDDELVPPPVIDDGLDDKEDENDRLEGWVKDRSTLYPFDDYNYSWRHKW